MNVHDWALVIFTILGQMAVGSFVILGVVHFFASRKSGIEQADKLSDRALLAIGPVLVLGMIATFFHLGNPVNAPRAFANLGSSWLSWEVLLLVVFIVLGGVFAIMQWRKVSTPSIRNVIAIVAAVVGLALVFAMAMVYMLPTVPAWNTPITVISFFTTTFLLGSLAMGAAYAINYAYLRSKGQAAEEQGTLVAMALRWVALTAVLMLGVQFIIIPLYVAQLATGGATAVASAEILLNQNSVLFALRLALVFLGAGVFGLFLYRTATSADGRNMQVMSSYVYVAFALALVAEVIGRYLFYASFVRIGI